MPTCPYCDAEAKRRAKGGRCPRCNRRVYLYKKGWYAIDPNGIPLRLLTEFEKRVAKRLNVPSFRIGNDGSGPRMAELGRARQLIQYGDISTAVEAIGVLFEHPTYNWKDRLSLQQISAPEWAAAMAIARKRLDEKTRKRSVLESVNDAVLAAMEDMKL